MRNTVVFTVAIEGGPAMQLSPSAHVDTFCRDSLPPDGLWPELRFSLPGLRYPERLNGAVELLDATADARGGNRPCLLSEGATWSYDDLVRASNQVAWVLVDELGLVPGNRVLLRGPNNPWLAACWLGVLKAGGVAVTAMSLLRAAELSTVCEIAQARLALCDHRFTGELAAAGVDGLQIVSYGAAGPQDDLVQRAAPMPRNFAAVDTAADDVALIASPSATTGRPRAAMLSPRALLAIADTFSAHVLKPRAEDIFPGPPPLAFTYGLGGLLVFPLRAGAATLLLERATPAELADQIAARGVTVLSTAPTAYRAMLAAGQAGQLRGLRRPLSAGEPPRPPPPQALLHAPRVQNLDRDRRTHRARH